MTAFGRQIRLRPWKGNLAYWPGPLILGVSLAVGLLLFAAPPAQTIVLLGVAAIIILALIQPLSALALALIAGPFGALESVLLGGVSLDSGQILLFIAIGAWIARGLIRRRVNLPKCPLLLPLAIFIAVGGISLLGATDLVSGFKELLKWVEIAVIMLMVVDLGAELGSESSKGLGPSKTDTMRGIPWIVAMLLFAGVIQALVGIWQFALRSDGPEHFLVMGRFYRAYGTFEQPNPFGGYMNMTALLALGTLAGLITIWLSRRFSEKDSTRVPARSSSPGFLLLILSVTTLTITALMGLIFSWSRGAWMGFLAGSGVMAVFWPRRLRYGLLVLFVVVGGILVLYQSDLLPPTVTERIGGFADDLIFGDVRGVDINDENYSVIERLAHWQAALDMADERPWFGIGFGNYAAAYDTYALINWPDPLGHAHNYYLNTLAEIGIAGLSAYLLLWGAIFWVTWRILDRETWPLRGVALGLLGVWTAIMVHHVVDKLYVNNIYIHLGVLLGLLQLVNLHGTLNLSRMEERVL